MGIRIVNRIMACKLDSISRSIVVDWDAKCFPGSPAGEKIELRADLCSWPQWERRLFGQVKRLKRMLAGVDGVLLAISIDEVSGMEEFLEHLASAVDESGLILWAVITAPTAWESNSGEAWDGINFPNYAGGGIVILPGQGRDHPEGRDVQLLHPSRRTEEIGVEMLFMLSDGLFGSVAAVSRFAGGYFYRAGIGRSVDAVEAAGRAMESAFPDECGIRDSGLVGMMVSGPDEMTSDQYSAVVNHISKSVDVWNRFIAMRLKTPSTDRLIRVLILASGIRP
jgi:hypothetical protein